MKYTIVFTTLLCVSTSWAVIPKEDKSDKREAPVGYGSSGLHSSIGSHGSAGLHGAPGLHGPSGLSGHSYQAPALHQGDANAISIGAGYSIGGGAKPTFSFGGQGSGAALPDYSEQGLSPNGHATIQLAPITLQPSQFSSGDLSQIMSQITHSLNAGGYAVQPAAPVAEYHQGGEGAQSGQELNQQQYTYGGKPFSFSSEQLSNSPAFSSGPKGLGSYSGTGPVLFTPEANLNAQAGGMAYAVPSSGQSFPDLGSFSFGGAGYSLGGAGHSLGGAGHSLGGAGHSQGGAGHSQGGAGHSLGGAGYLLGGAGHSLGGFNQINAGGHSFSGSYKPLSGGYAPVKTNFKPSAYIGSSGHGDSAHGLSSISGSYSTPSFGGFRGGHGGPAGLSHGPAGHGFSFGSSLGGFGGGSSKYLAPAYQSGKSEGLEGSSAYSSAHLGSPPGTSNGFPSFSSNNIHSASSNRPYYTKHHHSGPNGFSESSSAYRSPISSQNSYPSGTKFSFGGSSSHYSPKDAHTAASDTTYNTIKYSEELKPHTH